MSTSEPSSQPATAPILVDATDLPIYCPGPKAPLWSLHPRVYIEVAKTGSGACPYCSTVYQLKPGQHMHGH